MVSDKWQIKQMAEDDFFWTAIRERWARGKYWDSLNKEQLEACRQAFLEGYRQGYENGYTWAKESVGEWHRPLPFGY